MNRKYHTGPFINGFMIAMGSLLLIIGTVNFIVDPFCYREKRIKYINYLPVYEIIEGAPIMNLVQLYSKGPDVKFSVIGTSHVLVGIGNCGYPELEKIGVSMMSIKESSQVVHKILLAATVSKTVFIEVCGINTVPSMREASFFSKIFSFRTTAYSIRTMRHNLFNDQQLNTALCVPYIPRSDSLKSIGELNSKLIPLRPVTSQEILALKEMFKFKDRLKKDLHHQVVFFTSPLPQETMENEKYRLINQKLSEQMQQVLDSMQSAHHQIKFKYINLAATKIGNEYKFSKGNFYEGWYDGTHFKPVVGDQVVKYLMGHSN